MFDAILPLSTVSSLLLLLLLDHHAAVAEIYAILRDQGKLTTKEEACCLGFVQLSHHHCDLNVCVGSSAKPTLLLLYRLLLPATHAHQCIGQEETNSSSSRSLERQPCRSASQSCAEQDCWPSSPG